MCILQDSVVPWNITLVVILKMQICNKEWNIMTSTVGDILCWIIFFFFTIIWCKRKYYIFFCYVLSLLLIFIIRRIGHVYCNERCFFLHIKFHRFDWFWIWIDRYMANLGVRYININVPGDKYALKLFKQIAISSQSILKFLRRHQVGAHTRLKMSCSCTLYRTKSAKGDWFQFNSLGSVQKY